MAAAAVVGTNGVPGYYEKSCSLKCFLLVSQHRGYFLGVCKNSASPKHMEALLNLHIVRC